MLIIESVDTDSADSGQYRDVGRIKIAICSCVISCDREKFGVKVVIYKN